MNTMHRHKWNIIGRQKIGTVRVCLTCGAQQKKRERKSGHHLEQYWSAA